MNGVLRAWLHPAKLPTCKKVHRQQGEAYTNVIQGRVHWSCSQTWPYHPCGVGFRIMKDTLVNGCGVFRHSYIELLMSDCGREWIHPWNPEEPSHEALKVKVGLLSWRSQEVGKARDMRYLPKRATERRTSQREKCFVIIKTARVELCLWHQTWCYRI